MPCKYAVSVIIMQNLNNNCAWNIFSQVVAMSQNIRHNKFCLRLAMKVSVSHFSCVHSLTHSLTAAVTEGCSDLTQCLLHRWSRFFVDGLVDAFSLQQDWCH